MKRPFETRYWVDGRVKKPITRGFPKAEAGSAKGAGKIIMQGLASKVQCVNRETGAIVWTAKAVRVRGVNVCGVDVQHGDDERTTTAKKR